MICKTSQCNSDNKDEETGEFSLKCNLIEVGVSTIRSSVYYQQYFCLYKKRYQVYKTQYSELQMRHTWTRLKTTKLQVSGIFLCVYNSSSSSAAAVMWPGERPSAGIRSVVINENVLWLINTLPRPAGESARRQTAGEEWPGSNPTPNWSIK